MKTIHTEIIIEASAQEVWDILMDHSTYPEWNPLILSISGSTKEGELLEAMIAPPGKKPMKFKPVVLKKEAKKEFRWKGKLFFKGLFDGEHFFQLVEMGANRTKFIHGERFTGILVGPLYKMIGEQTKAGFLEMNEALKKRAEH